MLNEVILFPGAAITGFGVEFGIHQYTSLGLENCGSAIAARIYAASAGVDKGAAARFIKVLLLIFFSFAFALFFFFFVHGNTLP